MTASTYDFVEYIDVHTIHNLIRAHLCISGTIDVHTCMRVRKLGSGVHRPTLEVAPNSTSTPYILYIHIILDLIEAFDTRVRVWCFRSADQPLKSTTTRFIVQPTWSRCGRSTPLAILYFIRLVMAFWYLFQWVCYFPYFPISNASINSLTPSFLLTSKQHVPSKHSYLPFPTYSTYQNINNHSENAYTTSHVIIPSTTRDIRRRLLLIITLLTPKPARKLAAELYRATIR
jgi:hypothetical protein